MHADAAEALVAEITTAGGRAIAVVADVADSAAIEAMVAHTEAELGPVTILVNNAGVKPSKEDSRRLWVGNHQIPQMDEVLRRHRHLLGLQEQQARPLVGCSTETGSDAGKVFSRASSSASSWRLRLSLSPSSCAGLRLGSAIISVSLTALIGI
jgi:NAD(P)-dependent dehydrogenase (short-subunit alcohol dehydrogenase family)